MSQHHNTIRNNVYQLLSLPKGSFIAQFNPCEYNQVADGLAKLCDELRSGLSSASHSSPFHPISYSKSHSISICSQIESFLSRHMALTSSSFVQEGYPDGSMEAIIEAQFKVIPVSNAFEHHKLNAQAASLRFEAVEQYGGSSTRSQFSLKQILPGESILLWRIVTIPTVDPIGPLTVDFDLSEVNIQAAYHFEQQTLPSPSRLDFMLSLASMASALVQKSEGIMLARGAFNQLLFVCFSHFLRDEIPGISSRLQEGDLSSDIDYLPKPKERRRKADDMDEDISEYLVNTKRPYLGDL